MKTTKPTYYGILPANVRYNKNLIPASKVFYAELSSMCNLKGYCWASNSYFAELYDTTTRTIRSWLASLRKEGFIMVDLKEDEKGLIHRKIYLIEVVPLPDNILPDRDNKTVKDIGRKLPRGRKKTSPIILRKNSKIISKDIKKASDEAQNCFPYSSDFLKKCVDLWNSFPYTRNIQVTKRTKTISKLEKYIKELRKGTFLDPRRGTKKYNTEWFTRNKIPFGHREFTENEILIGIKRTAKYHKEGYWGNTLPKDLVTLLYNPRTHTSLFMKASYHPPKPLAQEIVLQDPNPEVTKHIIGFMNGGFDSTKMGDRMKLVKCGKTFETFCKNIPEESLEVPKIDDEVGDPLSLCEEYCYWIEHQDWIKEPSLNIMNTKNKLFNQFIKDKVEDYQGYELC